MAKLKAGWIETRKNGDGYRALLRYRDPLTGRKEIYGEPLYADTGAEAKKKAMELQPDLAQYLRGRKTAKREPEQLALGDWVLGGWKEEFESKLPGVTSRHMRQWWSKWLGPLVGNVPLGQFTPALAQGLVEHMQELGAGWPTIETAIKHLRAYLRDAVKEGLLEENPLDDFKLQAPELNVEEIKALAEPEFALELEHAVRIAWCMNDLEDTVLAESMCVAALRLGEGRAAIFANVLHANGRARTRFQVRLAVSGRGSDRELRGTKKTRGRSLQAIQRGFRSVQIVPALGRLYELLWRERGQPEINKARLAPGPSHSTLEVKNEANWRRREFADAVGRSRVQQLYPGKKVTPREFRAAAAAAYGNAQVPELAARDQLGHSSDTTTLRFYFSAYEDPTPELRDLSVDQQLMRARRLTLDWAEAELLDLQARRESLITRPKVDWHRDAGVYLLESVNDSRYAVFKEKDGWVVELLENDREPRAGKRVKNSLKTLAEAKDRAERQSLKRTRQSLTIRLKRLGSQLVYLRKLVAQDSQAEAA